MNKFRKPTSPAFNPGEIWISSSGIRVKIIRVWKHPGATSDHSSDYSVEYFVNASKCGPDDLTNDKDCWSFQVRYSHISDNVK